ncbi:MAG: hypothetical protein ACPKQO_00925 [Nitrososphaeraceae archaeon]
MTSSDNTNKESDEWSDHEFEARKRYVNKWLSNMSKEELQRFDSLPIEDQKFFVKLRASDMHFFEYEKNFDEFKIKWLEMKKLYIKMIELLILHEKNRVNIQDAKDAIKQDLIDSKIGITDTLLKYINQYFIDKATYQMLEDFKIHNKCSKPEYNKL